MQNSNQLYCSITLTMCNILHSLLKFIHICIIMTRLAYIIFYIEILTVNVGYSLLYECVKITTPSIITTTKTTTKTITTTATTTIIIIMTKENNEQKLDYVNI